MTPEKKEEFQGFMIVLCIFIFVIGFIYFVFYVGRLNSGLGKSEDMIRRLSKIEQDLYFGQGWVGEGGKIEITNPSIESRVENLEKSVDKLTEYLDVSYHKETTEEGYRKNK